MNATKPLAITLAAFAFWGCHDRLSSTAPTSAAPAPLPAAHMRGTVDVIAGTLTFEPIASTSASLDAGRDISAAIYGNQGVTARIYNSPVAVSPSTPGKKRYTANVGVRNLLAHPIGDEQAGPPVHILGIFVFVTAGPTVTGTSAPCSPACTVQVVNQHGIYAFSAPEQRYWYWPERPGAAGAGSDTTLTRMTWIFEADNQVTAFQFDVLVNAAWPPPHENRWKVDYPADSLPIVGSEPSWMFTSVGSPTTSINTPTPGMITITTPANARLVNLRFDSLATTASAYSEARFRTGGLPPLTGPEVSFGMADRVKFIAVGVTSLQAGFLTGSFAFQPGQVNVSTNSLHTYRIRKFASDSVVLWIDGVRRIHKNYTEFPPPIAGYPQGFYFGPAGTGAAAVSLLGNTSVWDYVLYEIGVTQP